MNEIVETTTLDPDEVLPPGVQPSRNYVRAIELGHTLARSGYFSDARDPAQAAVKVMIGMDLGLSPTAALVGIHAFNEGSKTVFVIEGKLLAALIKARPDLDYKIVERTAEKVEIEFLRKEPGVAEWTAQSPNIVWTTEDAKRAGLLDKDNWTKFPREMLTWRALVEGVRLHFPEILTGNPIFTDAEFGGEGELQEATAGPRPAALTDDEAEQLRDRARRIFEELTALEPVAKRGKRMARPLLETRIREAEHSHANLRNVVASLDDLLKSERRIVELEGELDERFGDAADLKALIDRGERKGSQQERIDLYEGVRDSFDRRAGESEPEGADDASAS